MFSLLRFHSPFAFCREVVFGFFCCLFELLWTIKLKIFSAKLLIVFCSSLNFDVFFCWLLICKLAIIRAKNELSSRSYPDASLKQVPIDKHLTKVYSLPKLGVFVLHLNLRLSILKAGFGQKRKAGWPLWFEEVAEVVAHGIRS